VSAAASRLSETLGDRRFLLVIDDAWRERDLRPFLQGGSSTTRLVTTRMDSILPGGIERVAVDAMKGEEALALLGRGLPVEQVAAQRPALQALAARLGEWPFLLTLVNSFLRERTMRASEPLMRAIAGDKTLRLWDVDARSCTVSRDTARASMQLPCSIRGASSRPPKTRPSGSGTRRPARSCVRGRVAASSAFFGTSGCPKNSNSRSSGKCPRRLP
jgi:hypothetical protein